MGVTGNTPVSRTFEVVQYPGGKYSVRSIPSVNSRKRGDLVALVFVRPLRNKDGIVFLIEEQRMEGQGMGQPSEEVVKVERRVRDHLCRVYRGQAVIPYGSSLA
jgi:hypothetical protein